MPLSEQKAEHEPPAASWRKTEEIAMPTGIDGIYSAIALRCMHTHMKLNGIHKPELSICYEKTLSSAAF
jgi:hypothetical protein